MTATDSGPKPATDATPSINFEVFDRLCGVRGATNETARASLVGIERTTLWRWRQGEQRPNFASLLGVARALETTVDELTKQTA